MGWKRIHAAIDACIMRSSQSVVVDGLWIGAFDDRKRRLLDRACKAVRLISELDPIKYRRLLRDVERIWVAPLSGNLAQYEHNRSRIVLSRRHFADLEDEVIAATIVHEATHARLDRFGYEEGIRARIEECCVRRELAFARKCPGGQHIVDRLSWRLSIPEADYSDAATEARQREEIREIAGESRFLQAFFRAVLWLRDRRNRKAGVGPK